MPSYPTGTEAADAIVDVGRLLYEKNLIVATEGNLSIRIAPNRILTTPSGRCKGRLRPWDLITVTNDGGKVGGRGNASSEILLHLSLYRERPEVGAVAHAHPPTATGFAVAGVPLADCVLPEVILTVGSVPLTPYGTPSTDELPERVLPTARKHDAFLLKNHGAVTLGKDLWQAFHRMEMVESFAKIVFTAQSLGRVQALEPADVQKLLQLENGPEPPRGGCGNCSVCTRCSNKKTSPGKGTAVGEVIDRIAGR